MNSICKLLAACGLVLVISHLKAQTPAGSFKNEFGFRSDNDAYLFYGQDRYYTNGLYIHFRHASDQEKAGQKTEKRIWEFSAGQGMYNPVSGYSPLAERQDRPFAGYLYAGAALSQLYKNESALKLGLQAGVIGPSALGRQAQELLHKIVGFYEIRGWEYQIRDEATLNLSANYTRLLYRPEDADFDISAEGYANLGNVFSGAGVSAVFRAGRINQLFNSAYLQATISNHAQQKPLHQTEFYLYIKPQLNFVAYDATIQGGLFSDNNPVIFGAKPLVFAQQLGVNYSSRRFTAEFGLTFKSREVKSPARPHQYGSISLYYRFN
ncbi:lipid A deacylase LpxR family protein [Pedobacter sp. SYP-B3415]|uniref:lipid A deacylase LpxR family protein n=1 Tax=Pedobacter sp. SYP-B3415 TaxID=2496641 RepID=UPI00101C7762|nr:lipid A deacylase LpxR family protein [Pedobacter sp. SYP-B3415]